eukprot:gene15683-17598_t
MIAAFFLLLTAFAAVRALPTCTLTCDAGKTCYSKAAPAQDCMQSMPFNIEWAQNTLDVLQQSMENFGFDALYHETGPPYSISLDVQGSLATALTKVNDGSFTNDFAFQEYVQTIFTTTLDAHTRYSKPKCYSATFTQPFAFDLQIIPDASNPLNQEPRLFLMENLYLDKYSTVFSADDLGFNVNDVIGKEVVLLNGIEFTSEIIAWGDTHETRSNNRGVRFNAALRSYLYRSAISYNIDGLTDLTVTTVDGVTYTFPWLAVYTQGLGDTAYCVDAAPTEKASATMFGTRKPSPGILPHFPIHVEEPLLLHHETLTETRTDRQVIVPSNDTFTLSCFVQTVQSTEESDKAGVSKVLVMKVASFSPPTPDGQTSQYAWEKFLDNAQKCLSVPDLDMIVVDVMQNGGGYVCLGLRLLELLVEDYENDHTLVQMNYDLPHSDLMTQYVEVVNSPDPFYDPEETEVIIDPSTQLPYPDGKSYYYPGRLVTQGGVQHTRTNFFALDCRSAEALPANNWRPPKFMPKDKLIILTDGTCGSTCASFTKIPQEHDKATFVGAGGLWNENMDVSSFAGGFICNPASLKDIATATGLPFPTFITNQRWQFGWATWYSAKLPSRQVQFTEETPTYRKAFWAFPHASISASVTTERVSALYDEVIATSITRLAVAAPETSSDDESCMLSDTTSVVLISAVSVLGVLFIICFTALLYLYLSGSLSRSKSVAKYGLVSDQLLEESTTA